MARARYINVANRITVYLFREWKTVTASPRARARRVGKPGKTDRNSVRPVFAPRRVPPSPRKRLFGDTLTRREKIDRWANIAAGCRAARSRDGPGREATMRAATINSVGQPGDRGAGEKTMCACKARETNRSWWCARFLRCWIAH